MHDYNLREKSWADIEQHVFYLGASPSLHLPDGDEPRSDVALTPTVHLVRRRTERRHRLLLRADTTMHHPTLLAQVPQLRHLQLRLCSPLRSRRLRGYGSELEVGHVELFRLKARKHFSSRSWEGWEKTFF